ncbi:hypothetical protein [Ascidiimonas sp. W6]|uniref:hypothetical protein n=1 Tax=Ascidiimonas meishanensis TaxID=3128903 RepID=UPI0030EC3E42
MKKLKMLVVLAIAFASCTTDSNQTQEDLTLDATTRNAILSELETQLTIEKGVPIKYDSYEVMHIDENYYLRARSGAYVTTTLLKENAEGILVGLGVSCTSSSCAGSTTECYPKWVDGVRPTCTPCTAGTKDCKRTITSGSVAIDQ